MGAWGFGNFDNDTALDFQAEVENANGPDIVLDRVRRGVDEGEDLDADSCCEILVAAEYVALALGKPGSDLGSVEDAYLFPPTWKPTRKEVALCVAAVRRVAIDSELSDLWSESSQNLEAWAAVVEDLLVRLGEEGL